MHLNSELLFKKYAKAYFKHHIKVLEIGPDRLPSTYQHLVNDSTIRWETLDMCDRVGPMTHVTKNEYQFPIPDNSFDIVLSGQVIEHVKKIWVWIREVARICKPGGHVIVIAPVSWPYHEAPVDCWRIYPEGMKVLYQEANLQVEFCRVESLEAKKYNKVVFGQTDNSSPLKRIVKRYLRIPTSCALDTVTIGRK